jgi:hypothetical protein
MSETIHTKLKIASRDEQLIEEFGNGSKITMAQVMLDEGTEGVTSGTFHSSMCYGPDGTSQYSMLMRLSATLSGRTGHFMLLGEGLFDGASAISHIRILEGSGTDKLDGISGSCDSLSTHSDYPYMPLALNFDFA